VRSRLPFGLPFDLEGGMGKPAAGPTTAHLRHALAAADLKKLAEGLGVAPPADAKPANPPTANPTRAK
jgi:hypothetical protein